MATFKSINDIKNKIEVKVELFSLLKLLEEVNPCNQSYDFNNNSLVISYDLKINLMNFLGKFPLRAKARIIGLPISLCEKGYFGDINEVLKIIHDKKGLKLILNGNKDLNSKGRTLSTFVFYNRFKSFDDYLSNMRHGYRRRIKRALAQRDRLLIRELSPDDFKSSHYSLYINIMKRTKNPLETLKIEFFQRYDAKIYEFLDRKTNKVLGFVQLKRIEDTLYFLFCGFNKEDNEEYDLYYNMLLKIVEEGIESGVDKINFGQTSEESKLKIGCTEAERYLSIYHSNSLVNKILQKFLPVFSYKPYQISHNVFKEEIK